MRGLMKPWLRELMAVAVGALIGGLATLFVALAGYLNKDRELDIQMLQIALGILREDPEKSQLSAARGWAVDVINSASPVEISPGVRDELIRRKFTADVWYDAGNFENHLNLVKPWSPIKPQPDNAP